MKLEEILKNVNAKEIHGKTDLDVISVENYHKNVKNGSLYIAISGETVDGHNFINQAIRQGAVVIVCEKFISDLGVCCVVVENSRKAMTEILSNFYNNPERNLRLVGVTGTNGKTTVTYMIKHVLESYGIKTGIIGTLGCKFGDKCIDTGLTTPDPSVLFKILKEMVEEGVKVVLMEVSAHAAELNKIDCIDFFAGVFTNLTQDHLDFFKDMDNYKKAKLKFLNKSRCKYLVVNSDDQVGIELLTTCDEILSYGIDNPADVFPVNVKQHRDGEKFVVNIFDDVYDVSLKLYGKFNVYNAMASLLTATLLGVPALFAVNALESFDGVSGRLEKIYDKDFAVFIDYAHTPDGLNKTLTTLKEFANNRLICLFGCGGNRDSDKRSKMGEISTNIADFTIITSDNPRFEEPMSIIHEIEKGAKNGRNNYALIESRSTAIEYALKNVKSGDVLVLAGKGSEKYQEILGVKQPFDDKEFTLELLANNNL